MTIVPIAIFWMLTLWGMSRHRPGLHLYLLFATLPMGAFAVVPTEISGSLTLTGPPVVAGFMLLKSIFKSGSIRAYLDSAIRLEKLGLLMMFWAVACTVSFVAPRLFLHQVEVVPMKIKTVGIMGTDMLFPTSQNISQTLYITVSVLTVFMFSQLLSSDRFLKITFRAFRFGAGVTVLTGMLDFLSSYLPITPLLEIFRTGGYALLTDNVVDGYKRVVGLMPEASAFGAVCLFFLCFLYFSRFSLVRRTPLVKAGNYASIFLLAAMLVLSMSSSAYVGLGIFVMLAGVEWIYRGFVVPRQSFLRDGLRTEWMTCTAICGAIALAVIVSPAIQEELTSRLDRLLFSKSESKSYEERNMWTEVSLRALEETSGFGCGLGGTRASNKVVSVFSNTGILGGVLFYAFVCQTLLRRSRRGSCEGVPLHQIASHAIRWSFLPIFMLEFLVGTTPDFGLANAWMYGLALAIAVQPQTSPYFGKCAGSMGGHFPLDNSSIEVAPS